MPYNAKRIEHSGIEWHGRTFRQLIFAVTAFAVTGAKIIRARTIRGASQWADTWVRVIPPKRMELSRFGKKGWEIELGLISRFMIAMKLHEAC